MGTLSSELGPVAQGLSDAPRVYADANVPAGLVSFMRSRLRWDVLFVIEHDDLRRASDDAHFRMARQLSRTLVTLDRDYLDDGRFPPEKCAGVLVISGPDERLLARLLSRLDRTMFRAHRGGRRGPRPIVPLPLEGRKLHLHSDWTGEEMLL
jgi:hypothetical protein